MRKISLLAMTGAALLLAAGVAYAQDDGAIAGAKAAGIVGEQADGYLGFAKAPPGAVKAAVDAVNIKRRQIYTDIAAKQGATVQEVAAARGLRPARQAGLGRADVQGCGRLGSQGRRRPEPAAGLRLTERPAGRLTGRPAATIPAPGKAARRQA